MTFYSFLLIIKFINIISLFILQLIIELSRWAVIDAAIIDIIIKYSEKIKMATIVFSDKLN